MTLLGRDEFMKAMDDDYTPQERAENEMSARLHKKICRRMNKISREALRKQIPQLDIYRMGVSSCEVIETFIRQKTGWIDLLYESNFMGFEPAQAWPILGEIISEKDDILRQIAKIRTKLDWHVSTEDGSNQFIDTLIETYPPKIRPEHHIQRSVLKETFCLGMNNAHEWKKVFNTKEQE
jgi:hypothetical protein